MAELYPETILIRDRNSLRRWAATDDWTWLVLAGALSNDPRNFDELARACLRFTEQPLLEDLDWHACEGNPAEVEGPWLLFDLACSRVVAGGGAMVPERRGALESEPGPREPKDQMVWINMPPHWKRIEDAKWENALPPIRKAVKPPSKDRGDSGDDGGDESEDGDGNSNVRAVLFGRALAEGIALGALEAARGGKLPARKPKRDRERNRGEEDDCAEAWYALTVRVHADWLLTPRQDLGGEAPRAFLHRGRQWVSIELQDRQMQWSHFKSAPRPLDRDTDAYRFGPLGTHEVVVYFELCRELIAKAWERLFENRKLKASTLAGILHQHTAWWMEHGRMEDDNPPPGEIVEKERRRIPLTDTAGHVFDDCPMCRMLADQQTAGMGPMFLNFDGHHLELDDEFAFSLCETKEEWQSERGEYIDASKDFEQAASASEENRDKGDAFESVWKSSYVNEEAAALDGSQHLPMSLATRMCEVVNDLKQVGAGAETIEKLNTAFDDYRAADLDPVLTKVQIARLTHVLEELASTYPELTPKVADLQSQLDERARLRRESGLQL